LKKLNIAIRKKSEYAELFRFDGGKKIARVRREDFGRQLDGLIKYFVEIEDYESADKATKLLKKHTAT
jgi:hypothetical protein